MLKTTLAVKYSGSIKIFYYLSSHELVEGGLLCRVPSSDEQRVIKIFSTVAVRVA